MQVFSTNSPARVPFPLLGHFIGFAGNGYDEGTRLGDPGEEETALWGNTRGHHSGIMLRGILTVSTLPAMSSRELARMASIGRAPSATSSDMTLQDCG